LEKETVKEEEMSYVGDDPGSDSSEEAGLVSYGVFRGLSPTPSSSNLPGYKRPSQPHIKPFPPNRTSVKIEVRVFIPFFFF